MKFEDIWPIVVDGGKVTCDRLGAGVFIDYQFNGLRINHPHGASSGFQGTEADREAEWREITDEDEQRAEDRRNFVGQRMRESTPAPAPAVSGWGKPAKPAGDRKPDVIRGKDRLRSMPIDDVAYDGVVSRDQAEAKAKADQPWKPLEKKELPKWT